MALTKVSSGLISADASSVDLNIDAGTLYIDATNNRVGIGTSVPAAYLGFDAGAYQNGTEDSSSIRWNDVGTADSILQGYTIGTDGANLWVGANSYVDSGGGVVAFDTAKKSSYISVSSYIGGLAFGSAASGNPTERMRIDSSGNVGIGTSSPASGVGSPLTLTSTSTGYVGLRLNGTGLYANDWDLYASGDGAGLDIFGIFDRTNTTYRLVVTNTGNVGIGTSSPALPLHVYTTGGNLARFSHNTATPTTTYITAVNASNTSNGTVVAHISDGTSYIGNQQNAALRLVTSDTERMRIDSSGNLLVGCTALSSQQGFGIQKGAATNVQIMHNFGEPSGSAYMQFLYATGAIGNIVQNGTTGVTYNTSSDYRLKENIQPLANGLERLQQLKPVQFDWKVSGETSEGFIAHEVQEVFPEAVSGEKDGEDMQGMDYGRITPLLVKAIQEQQTLIEQLQAEVALLKGE